MEALKQHLRAHYLRAIECHHASGTDTPHCACCAWPCPAQPNVGQAVERWVEHFMATLPQKPKCCDQYPDRCNCGPEGCDFPSKEQNHA